MSFYDCSKNNTYHRILKNYISGIGQTERLAEMSELEALPEEGGRLEGRSVGQVFNRNGVWEIHLVRVESGKSYRLVKRKLRSYPSREIAEIVARYTAAAECAGSPAKKGRAMDFPGICWN